MPGTTSYLKAFLHTESSKMFVRISFWQIASKYIFAMYDLHDLPTLE